MKSLLGHRWVHIAIALIVIGFVVYMAVSVRGNKPIEYVTTTVERGTVQQLVSVSGVVEAEQSAELAFPTSGVVSEVLVEKGDVVSAGDVLVRQEARALTADRQDALAARARAVATRDELLAGADPTTRAATAETIAFKEATLATTRATQADLIANAYRTLLSSDLTAVSTRIEEEAVAPTVTGTYGCAEEGSYILDIYSSGAQSGYSYRLTGLETGTFTATDDQASPMGSCGLKLQFDSNSRYTNTEWTISIPNKNSASYVTNRNAYTLAQTQAEGAIALAEQDLALARATAESSNAPARSEAIARANADITSTNARLARIDAQIADRTIRAPFAGTITELDVVPGETITTTPAVSLLAAAEFELTARIPEIDIGKLEIGQSALVVFDARPEETLRSTIEYISLQATEIDGVAYYEAIITFETNPSWLRSGLNADIDIVVLEATDTLRIPKRFVSSIDGEAEVLQQSGNLVASTTIDVIMEGNDGYVAITGLREGDIVVAP